MIGISDKQGEMLAFIEAFVAKHGYPPTREEIRTGLNISTKSLVNYHLEALENAALLTRIPNTPRGLKLLKSENGNGKTLPKLPNIDPLSDLSIINQEEVIELTYGMVTNDSNLYALKVEGDNLQDDSVSNGDIIILQRQSHAQNGEMVVVRLLEQNKTAIQQYHRENGHVRLEAADPKTNPLVLAPDAVEIQGKVVAIIRQVD